MSPETFPAWLRPGVLILACLVVACSGPSDPSTVRLDLDSRRPEQLVRFYLGAFGSEVDVQAAIAPGATALNLDSLSRWAPDLGSRLRSSAADGVIDLEELVADVSAGYYKAIEAAPRLEGFLQSARPLNEDVPWLTFEVSGSMTRFRRRMRISRDAVREALIEYGESGRIVYAPGTLVIGEHLAGSADAAVVETTAMVRRADGFWDFLAYDSNGELVDSIAGEPDAMSIPADCFGCHYGTRLFEPERSFPGQARPGPFGERAVHVEAGLRNREVAAALDEHRRRSDGLLGLYATLLLSEAAERRAAGERVDDVEAGLLNSFD